MSSFLACKELDILNKRPMGHIAHLRNNTYDYIIMLIKRKKPH